MVVVFKHTLKESNSATDFAAKYGLSVAQIVKYTPFIIQKGYKRRILKNLLIKFHIKSNRIL